MPPPAPPPLTELERRVLACGYDPLMGIEAASNNVRRWLRAEIDRRLRELAVKDTVEAKCRNCVVDVSASFAAQVVTGSRAAPLCLDCRSVSRAAETDAAASAWIELLGEQARELAGAIAALR